MDKKFDVVVTYVEEPVWHARGSARWQEMEAPKSMTAENVEVTHSPATIEVKHSNGDRQIIPLTASVKRVTIRTHKS